MQSLAQLPPIRWALKHPRVAAWIVLSAGMIILLAIEAQTIDLLPGQWIALFTACILVAGACIWIVSWEDDDEDGPNTVRATGERPRVTTAEAESPPPPSQP